MEERGRIDNTDLKALFNAPDAAPAPKKRKPRRDRLMVPPRKHNIPKEEGRRFLKDAQDGNTAGVAAFLDKYGAEGLEVKERDWGVYNDTDHVTIESDSLTALMLAVAEGHRETAELLIDRGADVNARFDRNQTVLMLANCEMAALLLDRGAEIDAADENGGTALMWPQTADTLRLLLSRGANAEAKDVEGMTALIRVAEGHYARGKTTAPANIAALLDGGANIDATDCEGRSPLIMAASRCKYDREEDRAYREMIAELMTRGANPDLRDRDGKTAAMRAREDGQVDVAEQLDAYAAAWRDSVARIFTSGTGNAVGVRKPLRFKK